jgi:hypothetical protein
MALKFVVGLERTTMPSSRHLNPGLAGSRVALVARAMAEVFFPKEESE